jgi:hypothetical protein
MRLFWSLLVIAGCQPGSVAGPDAPEVPGDGSAARRGLFIEWRATPAVPGPLTDRLTVADATFRLDHFQVTSDAGSTSTTRMRYVLAWSSRGEPAQEVFPEAPAGVYSKVSLAMMADRPAEYAYRIEGTWRAGDDTIVAYDIKDRMPLMLAFDCDKTLSAGGAATLTINLDLEAAIEGIDFDRLWEEGQTLIEIADGPELREFRDRMKRAFEIEEGEDEDE